jgi:glycosyltransferase XagB
MRMDFKLIVFQRDIHMEKLGELLIENNEISRDQLEKALKYQNANGGKIGVILVEMGFTSVTVLKRYLGIKV